MSLDTVVDIVKLFNTLSFWVTFQFIYFQSICPRRKLKKSYFFATSFDRPYIDKKNKK